MKSTFSLNDFRNTALNNFKEGNYTCSEALIYAFRKHFEPNISNEIIAAASGFSFGLGGTKCICGSVTGAVMILGLCFGRTEPKDPKIKNAMNLTKTFYERMSEKKGALCCAKIIENLEHDDIGKRAKCAEMVDEACIQAAKIIMENVDIKNTDES